MKGLFLLLAALVSYAAGKSMPLPSFITPCSRQELDLNACATKRGREAAPFVVKGDKRYKIPVMDPMKVSRLHVDAGVLGLNLTATDVVFTGLRNAVVNFVTWDIDKKSGIYDFTVPRIEAAMNYEISGRILILPITGSGRGNLTLVNMNIQYVFSFDLHKNAEGETYVIPTQGNLDFNTTRMYVHLDNLFNGNKLLGDEMNRFMDENWRDLVKELGPVIGDAVGEVMRRVQKNVFELVSYDVAFPDVPV